MVPAWLLLEESSAVVPEPSSNFQWAISLAACIRSVAPRHSTATSSTSATLRDTIAKAVRENSFVIVFIQVFTGSIN